jgi:predicted cupin superfamily sugar epimerase
MEENQGSRDLVESTETPYSYSSQWKRIKAQEIWWSAPRHTLQQSMEENQGSRDLEECTETPYSSQWNWKRIKAQEIWNFRTLVNPVFEMAPRREIS